MSSRSDRECLRLCLMDATPEVSIVVPVHLAGCEAIADCFLVNRKAVRAWKRAGAPIVVIGGRLTAEYNMLMNWHINHSLNA